MEKEIQKVLEDWKNDGINFFSFFIRHENFSSIMKQIKETSNSLSKNSQPLSEKSYPFLEMLIPLTSPLVDKYPNEQRRQLYTPYIKRLYKDMDDKIFYYDEDLEKIYHSFQGERLSAQILELEEKKKYLQESVDTDFKKLSQKLKEEIETRKKEIEKEEQTKDKLTTRMSQDAEGKKGMDMQNIVESLKKEKLPNDFYSKEK